MEEEVSSSKGKFLLVGIVMLALFALACYYVVNNMNKLENNSKQDTSSEIIEDNTSNDETNKIEDSSNEKENSTEEDGEEESDNSSEEVSSSEEDEVDSSEIVDTDPMVIGVIFDNYEPFKNLKFTSIAKSYYDGKITKIENNKIYYKNMHADNKTRSIKVKNAKSAAIICSCGNCDSILYINGKNELYEYSFLEKTNEKVRDNIKELTSTNIDLLPDTCGEDILIYKDTSNQLFVYAYGKEYPLSDMERTFIKWDEDNLDVILFKVSMDARVDKYLLDENSVPLHAKAVISTDESIYVIDTENVLYTFDDVFNNNVGVKGKTVESYRKADDEVIVNFTDKSISLLSDGLITN